jgi:hypothetical protein
MNAYNMRAFTLDGELFPFTVRDVPAKLTDNQFILTLRPGTPILLSDKIMRGADYINLYEGDIVESEGKKYLICYSRGFFAITEESEMKLLHELVNPRVIGNYFKSHFKYELQLRSKINFKYRDKIFNLSDILGVYNTSAVIIRVAHLVDPTEIQQEAGFCIKGTRMFFGDMHEGGILGLNYGRPSIIKDGEIYDIVRKEYIKVNRKENINV